MNIKDETKTDLEKYLYGKKLTRSQIKINLMQKKHWLLVMWEQHLYYILIFICLISCFCLVSELCDPGAQKQP